MFLLRAIAIATSERLPITLFSGSAGSGPSSGKPVRSWPMRVESSDSADVGMQQLVQLLLLLDGFIVRSADGDRQAGQDLQVIGIAAVARHAALEVGVERLGAARCPDAR